MSSDAPATWPGPLRSSSAGISSPPTSSQPVETGLHPAPHSCVLEGGAARIPRPGSGPPHVARDPAEKEFPIMPTKRTLEAAHQDAREGKSPSTQAGEFVHEEIEHVREGKHGARSTKQAIAIGLSKARRAGVKLPPPKRGRASASTIESAESASRAGRTKRAKAASPKRARATREALQREGHSAVSSAALARQAKAAARKRSPAERRAAAKKAARTRKRR